MSLFCTCPSCGRLAEVERLGLGPDNGEVGDTEPIVEIQLAEKVRNHMGRFEWHRYKPEKWLVEYLAKRLRAAADGLEELLATLPDQ